MKSILLILALAVASSAKIYFAEEQILPSDVRVDFVLWMPMVAPVASAGGDSVRSEPWDCASVQTGLKFSTCRILEINRPATDLDHHLSWALLNLSASSYRGELTARPDHRPDIDNLAIPVVAMRKRADSCTYVVVSRESYAPLAGGKTACRDFSEALAGFEGDLSGRFNRVRKEVRKEDKVVRTPYSLDRNRPHTLDLGLEISIAGPIMLSGDKEPDSQDGPFAVREERFDLEDLASHDGGAFAGRFFFQYRKLIGLRFGFEYSRLELESDVVASIRSQSGETGLQSWNIDRYTTSGEILLGKAVRSDVAELYGGAVLGLAHTRYEEYALVSGKSIEVPGLLKNVTGPYLGAQGQLRIMQLILIGLEAGVHIKDFGLKNATTQPDGSGSEFQFRAHLGVLYTFDLAPSEGP